LPIFLLVAIRVGKGLILDIGGRFSVKITWPSGNPKVASVAAKIGDKMAVSSVRTPH
jgi:hypothetical protein